jgi:FkbM family methyltransferase
LYVGANRGQYFKSLRAAYPSARIILFEPDPEVVGILRNILTTESNYEVKPFAVGSANETKTFYATSLEGNGKLSSSLLKMTQLHEEWSDNSSQVEEFQVSVVKLDDQNLDKYNAILLKIDTQGYELPALLGASRLLSEKIVAIDTEISFQKLYVNETNWLELIQFLASFNLKLFGIDPWGIYYRGHGELLQADAFFVKDYLFSNNSQDKSKA